MATSMKPLRTRIFRAKRIHTMDPSTREATAVAVRGARVVAVGSNEEVERSLAGEVVEHDDTFADKVLVPGFIDQHLHPILGALSLATEVISTEDWVLPGRVCRAAYGQAEYIERLRAAEAAIPAKDEWLFSWGYHELWHGDLDRSKLDGISATRPIAVWQRSCHEFYLNSAALTALGLEEAALASKGRASEMMSWAEGHFWETGMNLILGALAPVFATPERVRAGLEQMVAYLHANGVTAFNEPGAVFTPPIWKLYLEVLGADRTPFYSFFLPDGRSQVDKGLGLEESLADAKAQVALAPTGKVSFFDKQIKLFADGAIISQLMIMKDGYLDGHTGEWMMTPEKLEERTKLYWDVGYQLHIHVNGDGGLETLLDILERRMRENPRADHRTVIVHFANSTEEQIARIARLGAIVSANPYYTVGFADAYGAVGLGPARADMMVRSASVLARHIPLSFHSDLPMGPCDPLYLAWCAVNRVTPSGRVAGPEQRISVEQALRALTIEAAYSWRKEAELGSITPGKIANFTVLEADPLAVPTMDLKDVPVWGTVFEGRIFPVPAELRRRPAAPREVPIARLETSRPHPRVHDHEHGADSCGLAREFLSALGENLGARPKSASKRRSSRNGASARR